MPSLRSDLKDRSSSRVFCLSLVVIVTVALNLTVITAAQAQNKRPRPNTGKRNVLFLICDDLNCDIGCYGHSQVKTPNIDALAQRGVRFSRAYCQYPLCGPSRASFMTGLYPDQNLVRRNAIYIREKVPNVLTIPQSFRSEGYFAQRINKIFHYNVPRHIGTSGHDDPYSWNQVVNTRGRDKDDADQIFSLRKNNFGGTLSWLAADGTDEEQTDGMAAIEAAKVIRDLAERKQSFYMAVGLFRPHTPFVAPKKYFDMYPLEDIKVPKVPKEYFASIPKPAAQGITKKKDQFELREDLARQAIQAYYASISFADAQLKHILDALDESGLRDNTVIVFTSDHGYHMGEHGHWQKMTLFENATRVPVIISGPSIQSGVSTDALFEMVDFFPTLTELCDVKASPYISGTSQVPVLQGEQESVRDSALSQMGQGYSLRTDRYRLTAWGEDGKLGVELYDHRSDPEEMKNLAGLAEYQATRETLLAKLKDRVAEAAKAPAGLKQTLVDIRRNVPQPND